jgi:hypothetical protein
VVSLVASAAACRTATSPPPGVYLYVWAGDSAARASDFLGVIDASPSSPTYGSIVASLPTGVAGTHPHHTEAELGPNRHLLANGFSAGRTWLYDLSSPREPKILTSFGDVAGLSHPHTYIRLPNGNVLATFQYKADSSAPAPTHDHDAMGKTEGPARATAHATGGLVEMDERGTVIRSASASDPAIADRFIYPYTALPIPSLDRVVSTTTDMDESNKQATSQWVQLWRLSDLTLRRSVALDPGPRGNENQFTGEPRLLPDGKSVYIHTFNCGVYLRRGVDTDAPTTKLVKTFPGKDCGVPVLTGHYWLQTVPETHGLVALDVTDPENPREVSSLSFGDDEKPHWVAIDGAGRRLVLSSAGGGTSNRLYVIDFDPATGALRLDERFRDAGASRPGVRMSQRAWPHGFTGTAWPHGTVFSR